MVKVRKWLLVTAALLAGALVVSCEFDGGGGIDDHVLNPSLVGTWKLVYEGGSDKYFVTTTTITHIGYEGTADYAVEYVYNFNDAKTAGGIIVKTAAGKYTAIWFRNLKPQTSVLLGQAWTVANWEIDPSVDTLEEAKERFSPANAESYGGGASQKGSPQLWIP